MRSEGGLAGIEMYGSGKPTVVIDAAITEHFEVLHQMPVTGLRIIKRVGHADPFDRSLRNPINHRGRRDAGRFENGWNHINNVMPLVTDFALGLNTGRPMHDGALAGSTIVRRHLFEVAEGRIESDRPAGGHVRIGLVAAPFVNMLGEEIQVFRISVQGCVFIEGSIALSFRAGSVIARNVEDQRVVHDAQLFYLVQQPVGFGVGHVEETGEDFGLAGKDLLFLVGQVFPVGNHRRLGW